MQRSLALLFVCGIIHSACAQRLPLVRDLFRLPKYSEAEFEELVLYLNNIEGFRFVSAYQTESTLAFYSSWRGSSCWLRRHRSDAMAVQLAAELQERGNSAFAHGNISGVCLRSDAAALKQAVLSGLGEKEMPAGNPADGGAKAP